MNNPFFNFTEDYAEIIDQTKLPGEEKYIRLVSVDSFYEAIRSLRVRGAPAIGVTAAYGCFMDARMSDPDSFRKNVVSNIDYLKKSRPTAVNLFNNLNDMLITLNSTNGDTASMRHKLFMRAEAIKDFEIETSDRIAQHGIVALSKYKNILTHCNTGMLATPGIGTALGILYELYNTNKDIHVYVPETRPLLQGSRLTVYELMKQGVPHTLITDSMRGTLMSRGRIDAVITGADRIALNGDTANKIGTMESAVLARHFNIPFFIAAPTSTIDRKISSGESIDIEQRDGDEIRNINGICVSVSDNVYNPAFDITPAELITGIITEKGVIDPCESAVSSLLD
ncbi:MAG: S-methyl-5-thioribose-1-phosphate isomerase [candidate division WOR-3 bacterium]|nr:S-methyl-5-thioribose-1-phosphate isomerase [candidate division WOR-3 bacterium]